MAKEIKHISYSPTTGLSYDPEDPVYWDQNGLNLEITRIFEICHGCRMCFKYCDSFPILFDYIDNNHDGEVLGLTHLEKDEVFQNCFQCKLCEVQCPYTPRENHAYQVDFPKLVHRHSAQLKKKKKTKLREMILSHADLAGKFARLSFGLANFFNKLGIFRFFMELFLGIHRKKLLPEFALETFESWAKKNNLITPTEKISNEIEVGIFQTCFVQNNEPQIGKDTIFVLQKNNVNLTCIKDLKCCGMPFWEHGDLDSLRKNASHNLDCLLPLVEKGLKIIPLNPTCAMIMRREYPQLLEKEKREDAKKLAEAIFDPGEFLWSIRKEERFNTDFKSTPGQAVGYHIPCHLRAQSVGFKGRDILGKIPGVTPKTVMECCGHDGTHAMKKEFFEKSINIGKKAFGEMKDTESQVWATDCPLAALQFKQHAGIKPMHPMSILARAYKPGGFGD